MVALSLACLLCLIGNLSLVLGGSVCEVEVCHHPLYILVSDCLFEALVLTGALPKSPGVYTFKCGTQCLGPCASKETLYSHDHGNEQGSVGERTHKSCVFMHLLFY